MGRSPAGVCDTKRADGESGAAMAATGAQKGDVVPERRACLGASGGRFSVQKKTGKSINSSGITKNPV